MYAVVKHSIPMLRAFTICLWLRPAEGGIGTPLSYAVPAQPNELVLLQGLHTPTELLINDKVSQAALELTCPLLGSNRSSQGGLCNALWLHTFHYYSPLLQVHVLQNFILISQEANVMYAKEIIISNYRNY